MRCPACSVEMPERARFCAACGAPARAATLCPTCQAPNKPTARFCRECGGPLRASDAAPSVAPPAPADGRQGDRPDAAAASSVAASAPPAAATETPASSLAPAAATPPPRQVTLAEVTGPGEPPPSPPAALAGTETASPPPSAATPSPRHPGRRGLALAAVAAVVAIAVGAYLLLGRGGWPLAGLSAPSSTRVAGGQLATPSGPPVSRRLSPSGEAQSVALEDRVTVTVPGGALKEARDLTITPLGAAPDPTTPGGTHLAAYDISLGDLRELEKELVIEIAVEPARVGRDLLWLEYWDEVQKTWVVLPSEVDLQRKTVRARTRHLCPVTVTTAEYLAQFIGQPVSSADRGKVYYSNGYFFLTFDKAEVQKGTGPGTGWYEKSDPTVKPVGSGMPGYVEDVWAYLNAARERYSRAGLRDLPKHDASGIFVQHGTFVFVGGAGSPYRNKITGFVNISLDCASGPAILKHTVSHELFHAVQARYYTAAGMTARKWWMEATADYAADRIAGGGNRMGGEKINPRFLEKRLTYASSAVWDAGVALGALDADPHGYHEYTAAFFLDYLVSRKSIDFADMFNKVAEYWSSDIDEVLDDYLKTKGTSMVDAYRGFARRWLFDLESPVYTRAGVKSLMAEVAEPGLPTVFSTADEEKTASVGLDARQSAKLWAMRVEVKGIPGNPATRKLKVESDDLASLDVYAAKAGDSSQTRASIKGSIDPPKSSAPVVVEVSDSDILYVVVYNQRVPMPFSTSVKVTSLDVVIDSIEPAKAWYDEEVTLKGKGFGKSQGNSRLTVYLAGQDTGMVVTPTAWSEKEIKFRVPRGILNTDTTKEPSGEVDVGLSIGAPNAAVGGLLSNRARLAIGKLGPEIKSVSPTKGLLGSEVTIAGSGFGVTLGASSVTLNRTVVASNQTARDRIVTWSDKEIKVRVPNNCWSGDVVVRVAGVDSNRVPFEVDFAAHLKQMNRVVVSVAGQMTYRMSGTGGARSATDGRSFEVNIPTAAVSVEGQLVRASSSETAPDGTQITSSIEGVLDPSGGSLASATVTQTRKRPGYSEELRFNLRNVPLRSNSATVWYYQAPEGSAAGSVSDVRHSIAWPTTGDTRTFVEGQFTSASVTFSVR